MGSGERGIEVQGHPQLRSQFEVSLGNRRLCLIEGSCLFPTDLNIDSPLLLNSQCFRFLELLLLRAAEAAIGDCIELTCDFFFFFLFVVHLSVPPAAW